MAKFKALQTGILASLVFLAAETGAQSEDGTLSSEWISTQWDLWCPEAESADVEPCDGFETAASVFMDYLESASAWYRELNFPGPKVVNRLGRYQAHVVRPDDAHADGEYFSGLYETSANLIVLNGDDFFAMGSPGETHETGEFRVQSSFMYTSVHELFHGIQATYGDNVCGEGRGWICEGMADAALRAYADKFEPESNIAMETRFYHTPLHKPGNEEWGYGTWNFWLDVGERLNSTDRIRYFREVMSHGLDSHQGLMGVDHALKDLMTGGSDDPAIRGQAGLYDMLPWFFTQRDAEALFSSPLRRTVRLPANQDSVEERITRIVVQPVAGRAVKLTVRKPAGKTAAVKIRFAEPSEDLHLIVNQRRFDLTRGENRNVFFDIYDDEQTIDLDIVIANVAKTAQTSSEVRVDLVVEVLTEFASMGINAASETLVQEGIELDRIRMNHIIPALTALQQDSGLAQPCALRLSMSSSVTGDTLELHMDHEGPISPRAFPVVALRQGRYEPPEEHANEFVVSFGIGEQNIISGGYDQAFGARSGAVFIDRIEPPFIEGRVEVVGERQISGKYVGDEWVEFPANLETVPMGARFRLMLTLPPGTRNHLTMERCFVEQDETLTTGGGGSTSGSSQNDGEDADEEDTQQQPDEPAEEDVLAGDPDPMDGPPPAQPPEPGVPDPSPGESELAHIESECRPLYFSETERFAGNAELPFTFRSPLGWMHSGDGGALRGTVHPAEYRDSGIKYDGRWARNAADAAMADGLQKASWQPVGQADFGSAQIDVYGGEMGDAFNTYAILPIGDRHLILEVRFLGRRACGREPLDALRETFWESIAP